MQKQKQKQNKTKTANVHGWYQNVKNEKELGNPMQAARILSQDIGIEFGIEKRARLIGRSGKRKITEGMELPNQENSSTHVEKET